MLDKMIGRWSDGGQDTRQDVPWWVWLLSATAFLALIGWWLRGQRQEESEEYTPRYIPLRHGGAPKKLKPAAPANATPAPEPEPETAAAPVTPDDLKRIEGIGPKIAGLLQDQGIYTYAQLAATDESRLREILAAAGLQHLARPATWPEQAALAARGNWDALQALQAQLKGGRRT